MRDVPSNLLVDQEKRKSSIIELSSIFECKLKNLIACFIIGDIVANNNHLRANNSSYNYYRKLVKNELFLKSEVDRFMTENHKIKPSLNSDCETDALDIMREKF